MRRKEADPSVFSTRLRELRKLSGMTQKELAEHLDLDRSTYAYYETGAICPSFPTLLRMAAEFRVTTDYLLGVPQATGATVRQPDNVFDENLDGAKLMHDCDREERSFLSLFRRLDAEDKQKLLACCMDLVLAKEPPEQE